MGVHNPLGNHLTIVGIQSSIKPHPGRLEQFY